MARGPIVLKRKLSRRTAASYSTAYTQARPVVVTIMPGDVLEFRELGRRERWHLAIDTAFKYAIRLKAGLLLDEPRVARVKRK